MTTRIDIHQLGPKAYQAMLGLEGYLVETGLTLSIKELIKFKVSMINKCVYCIQMHSEQARENGESEQGLSEATYQSCLEFFNEQQVAQLIMQVVTINAWNRIAVATKLIYRGR